MKTLRLSQSKPIDSATLVISELPRPQPGLGQLLVRVHACGVCHADLHTIEGDISSPGLPITPGHQLVRDVEDFGEGVRDWSREERALLDIIESRVDGEGVLIP
jgi:propanol-preferring alcohol dehydrogenase